MHLGLSADHDNLDEDTVLVKDPDTSVKLWAAQMYRTLKTGQVRNEPCGFWIVLQTRTEKLQTF